MASVRLTRSMIDATVKRLILNRFRADVEVLIADQAQLADAAYLDVFPPKDRERMLGLPEGWLPLDDDIGVKFNEHTNSIIRLEFDGTTGITGSLAIIPYDQRPKVEMRRVPYKLKDQVCKIYPLDHPLSIRNEELEGRRKDLTKAIEEAQRSAQQTLSRFSTVGALIKGWPEIEPFVARYLDDGPADRSLPVVAREKLNDILGLPVDPEDLPQPLGQAQAQA